jgi:hypothetical protein
MKLLHSVKRFLASEDGAAGIEKVVVVGCTVILCMSIQINAHRHARMASASEWHAPYRHPVAQIALAFRDAERGQVRRPHLSRRQIHE